MGIWFGFITLCFTLPFVWFMPKRISLKEIYISWGWLAAITFNIDLIFGLILDLYDFESPSITIEDLILQFLLPPSFGVIILNFMPFRKRDFVLYLIGMTLFAITYEVLSLLTGYLVYKGWKLWFSVPFYALVILYLRIHLSLLRKH